jgi:hypothetical protein
MKQYILLTEARNAMHEQSTAQLKYSIQTKCRYSNVIEKLNISLHFYKYYLRVMRLVPCSPSNANRDVILYRGEGCI